MRRACLAAALGLAAGASAAAARPASLAVRPTTDGATASLAAERLAGVLESLTIAPESVQPLLAGGRAAPLAKTSARVALRRAAMASGPAAGHALGGWFVLRFADVAACDAALAAFAAHPAAFVAEPVRELRVFGVSSVAEIPTNVAQVRAPEAMALVTPDSSIRVAVIDTGCDLTHPDLVRRIWRNDDPPGDANLADDTHDQNDDGIVEPWERDDDDDNGYVDDEHGYDFTDASGRDGLGDARDRDSDPSDDQGHGTHVAGIIAADGSLRGVAPFVQLMPVRAGYATAFGGVLETDDAAAAIVYAVDNGARILNLSWGDTEESILIREAVAAAAARGVLIVAAAGNGGDDAPHWPSGEPGVVGVGAVDGADARSRFSNFGPGVALFAPGERFDGLGGGIVSLAPGGGRATLRGTSMAAPHVAGVAAIVMSRADRPDASRVRALLLSGARRPTTADWSDALAHGVVDAVGAVRSQDDLVVEVLGPARPFRQGRVRLFGTVLGGDLARWRIDARPRATGATIELVPWQSRNVAASTLADIAWPGGPEGDWESVLVAETGAGGRREVHGAFTVDLSAPRVDTLAVAAAWRAAEPRWLVSAAADEEVSLAVAVDPLRGATLHDAGLARRAQIESPVAAPAAAAWRVTLENAAGLARDTLITAPGILPAWPETGRLMPGDATNRFSPESLWGPGPGGTPLVWGSGRIGDSLTTVQAWGAEAGRLALRYDAGFPGRAAGFADTNGDGAGDLLVQERGTIRWFVTRRAGTFPDSLVESVAAERGLGFFQLDGDPPVEALLSSGDSLFLYDDASAGAPRRLQGLANPARQGFDVFGADAAVGDLDGDGAIEIACGDAEGQVTVYGRTPAGRYAVEWTGDTGGTYAYDLTALRGGGFVVGRQRTASVTGDGFPTVVYEFLVYAPQAGGYVQTASYAFLAPENDLQAGSVAAPSVATGEDWLVLVRGTDLYLLHGAGRDPDTHVAGAAGEAPALLDFDGDGTLDLVLRTADGASWQHLDEGTAGPHDLAAESLGADRLRLTWSAGPGDSVRVRRAQAAGWETLGTTTATSWIDSTLQPLVAFSYEVEALVGGVPRGTSNRIVARAQPLPRLLATEPLGPTSLRVRCSNPLGPSALEPRHWRVQDDSLVVVRVALASDGREVQLVLERELGCGNVRVEALDLRDDQGGRLAGPDAVASGDLACVPPRFLVQHAAIVDDAVVVEFNRAFDPATLATAHFDLQWNGAAVPIDQALPLDAARVRLVPAATVAFVGLGIPYLLRVDGGLRAAGDGASLESPATAYVLRVAGPGAASVFPAPNPVRPGDASVTFAQAGPETRISIYTLEGDRVRDLSGALGGGITWDLRDAGGRTVASGPYIYVARDPGGSRRGTVVILH